MKFERLKKSHKKEIIIGGMIILGIISAITLTTSRAKYRLTQSIPIVRGTINYKPYDLKIMAMYKQKEGSTCTEDNCYDEITGAMPSSGYVVNQDKSYCLTSNNEQVKGKIKTVNGTVTLTNLIKNDKCYIWFDKEIDLAGTILTKLNITYKTTIPNFTKIAQTQCNGSTGQTTHPDYCETTNGIYRAEDGMYGGYSYYWRGDVTNNHVIFADKCWRIIRINGDGTIRLIYNGAKLTGDTCTGNGVGGASVIAVTNQVYYSGTGSNNSETVGWTFTSGKQRPSSTTSGTASNAKTQVETWFKNNIKGTNLEKVANGNFCNARENGTMVWNKVNSIYESPVRCSNGKPSYGCSEGDTYHLNVGLITLDEVVFAGGALTANTDNGVIGTTNFLYNSVFYVTMTPWRYQYVANANEPRVASVSSYIGAFKVAGSSGFRPVINLKADVTFQSGGLGTSEKPYIVAN